MGETEKDGTLIVTIWSKENEATVEVQSEPPVVKLKDEKSVAVNEVPTNAAIDAVVESKEENKGSSAVPDTESIEKKIEIEKVVDVSNVQEDQAVLPIEKIEKIELIEKKIEQFPLVDGSIVEENKEVAPVTELIAAVDPSDAEPAWDINNTKYNIALETSTADVPDEVVPTVETDVEPTTNSTEAESEKVTDTSETTANTIET